MEAIDLMKAGEVLRDTLFRVRYGFRGVPVQCHGASLRLDESLRRWNREVEREVQEALCENLAAGDVFVDVGANFGFHSLLAATRVGPTGHVYAMEPVPSNCSLLRQNVALNRFGDRISVIEAAVADVSDCQMDLYGVHDGVVLDANLRRPDSTTRGVPVAVTTLDVCLAARAKAVSLIKVDVEGAEHLVVRGARMILHEDRPLLLVEVHTFALPSFGSSAAAFVKALSELGYTEQIIDKVCGEQGDYYHALYTPAEGGAA
jgi:FkbM family methyltransferase